MRINNINSVIYLKNRKNYTKEKQTAPIKQEYYDNNILAYIPVSMSFKGKLKNDGMSLLKEISESLGDANTPELKIQDKQITTQNVLSTKSPIKQQALVNKEADLIKNFENKTTKIYYNPKSDNDEKLKAFNVAYAFAKEKPMQDKELLVASTDCSHPIFAEQKIKKVFFAAKEIWQTKYLPVLLQKESEKLDFIAIAESKMPELKEMKSFQKLSVDDKFFVAKYYEINDFKKYTDDPMTRILTDRQIEDKNRVFSDIRKKIVLESEIYQDNLRKIPELIKTEEGLIALSNIIISGGNNADENTDMLSILISCCNINGSLGENKLEYFSKLGAAEIEAAINKMKDFWAQRVVPLKMEKEVFNQAYYTDIHVKNNIELTKINANLEKIDIKLDKMSISLTEFLQNIDKIYTKYNNPVENSIEMQKSANMHIEEMKQAVTKMSDEEQKILLNTFRTKGIDYLDMVIAQSSDLAVRNALNDMKKTIITQNTPSTILARLEGYGTMALLSGIVHGGKSTAANVASCHEITNLTDTGDAMNAISTATSDTPGIRPGISSFISPEAIALTAVATGLYSIYKSSQVNKTFGKMYFGGTL